MPLALTPKVPLTVVANQGTEEMATIVQVGAWKVFSLFSLVFKNFLLQENHNKMFRHKLLEFVRFLKTLLTFYFRRRRMPDQLSQL